MKKIDLGVVVTTLIIVTISCSLAFFAARVVGEPKDINLVAKNVAITFNDTSIIANGVVSPGWNTTKTFTITNNSKEEYKYNISIKDLINTFVTEGYLQYKITSTNNGYNMTEFKDIPKSSAPKDTILAYSVSIPVGVTQSYTIEFKYTNDESVDQSEDMGKVLKGTLFITEGTEPTLLSQLLADKSTVLTRTDFSSVLTTNNTKTLYTSTENGTTVYYFAGNATDNWVKFGSVSSDIVRGYGTSEFDGMYEDYNTMEECKSGTLMPQSHTYDLNQNCTYLQHSGDSIYWRIIRTNSDGGVRLLYHGTSTTAENAFIGTSKFNSSSDNIAYVSYMYGSLGSIPNARTNQTNSSTIKTTIDNWYAKNMTSYTKYLSTTAVYCNDRSTSDNKYFGAYTRLDTNKTPTYDCEATEDKFTVDTSTGNGKLTYPIALMTADEISFAGGLWATNAPTWYYNSANGSSTGSTWWWLLSPDYWDGADAYVFGVSGSSNPGRLSDNGVYSTRGVRPAVSLKSCVKTSGGDGSASAPYTIEETTSGC